MAEKTTQVAENKQNFGEALTVKLDSVTDALPKDFNKTRFVQNCISVLNDNAETLAKYSQAQIMAGLLKGASLGLEFVNKECYLIPYGSKLNYQTSYTGEMKLAKKYSTRPIKEIYAKLIREGDVFEETIINGEQTFNFKPKFLNDGAIIGAFAAVIYRDGGMNYEVMTLSELENTRKHSKASNSPAWKDFTGEMYRKTVIRRLCKYIDLEFENPAQRNTFDEEAAIETDVKEIHDTEVEAEANTVEFFVDGEAFEVTENAD